MDMPPSRYKVVEKGRRLIVIDRRTGEQVRHQLHETPHRPEQRYGLGSLERPRPNPPSPSPSALQAGGRQITTASWYDDKAPRTLILSDDKLGALVIVGGILASLAILLFFLFNMFGLFVAGFLLLQKGARGALRRGATAWLDSIEDA